MSDESSKKCVTNSVLKRESIIPITSDSLKEQINVAAGKEAEAAFHLVNHPQPDRFYLRLIELCQEKLPKVIQTEEAEPKEPVPMNTIMAKSFEKTKVPFGKYKEAYVGQCKLDYLEWLAGEDSFIELLRRYVVSERFQQRKRNEC